MCKIARNGPGGPKKKNKQERKISGKWEREKVRLIGSKPPGQGEVVSDLATA